ncbi:ZIP family metal transporter [Mucilaginibacter sp. UYCu711]|uniref:ZIP family metal transporter n=1 Tax=Mucilaginibacter sp. UYCu711 TaxID=3156339 RepID=UPI003D1B204F
MIIIICIATFVSTLLGGLFALRFKNKLYLILGFSAGAVIGVAFFDLLPTAMELSAKVYGIRAITSMAGFGFIFYLLLDRSVVRLSQQRKHKPGLSTLRGKIAAGCLTIHSLVDGIAIGLAFQVSAAIGGIVATAVLVHDFADGINTTNVILKTNGNKQHALKWLVANAAAPVLGAFSTFYYKVPEKTLGILLALVSGFFLYIGASDFLPESQQLYPKFSTTLMTVLGIAIIYAAIKLSAI